MRLGGACALLLLLVATAAADDDPVTRARRLYDSGTAHYNLAEYKDALGDFKLAYRLQQDATFLFNIAQCYRQLGDPSSAASFYRAYRRESPDQTHRGEVDRLIAEMDRAVQEQRARQPPTGTKAPEGASTMPVVAAPSSSPTAMTTTAAPSSGAATANQLVTSPPPRRSLARKPWFWATLVGAAAVVAVGVTLGVVYGAPAHDPTPTAGAVPGN